MNTLRPSEKPLAVAFYDSDVGKLFSDIVEKLAEDIEAPAKSMLVKFHLDNDAITRFFNEHGEDGHKELMIALRDMSSRCMWLWRTHKDRTERNKTIKIMLAPEGVKVKKMHVRRPISKVKSGPEEQKN